MLNIKKATTGLLIALALVLTLTAPVSAGLRVGGAKIEVSVTPGSVNTYTMNVGNTTNESMDITVEVRGLGNYITGSIEALPAENDSSPYSARTFVTAEPTSFHLEPGQSQDVTVTINVPGDVGDGGRYADVFIYTAPSGEGQIGVSVAVSAQVLLTIDGSNLVRTGIIMSVDIPQPESEQLFATIATIQNTGNYHYKVTFNGTVTNDQGRVVGTAWQTNSPYNLIPTFSQQVAIPLNISEELSPGTYYLTTEADTQDGIPLDTRTTTFILTGSYKPMALTPLIVEFWDEGKLSIYQKSMAQDGTLMEDVDATSLTQNIEIVIAQGTKVVEEGGGAAGPISVTTMDQLPTPPVNYSVSKAYEFNPEGIQFSNGAAYITLGYTANDIPNGVDESQLKAATFDTETLQWVFLDSDIDTEANTITFSTTHFSVFAIVSPTGQGSTTALGLAKSTWIWIGIGVLCVVIIAFSINTLQRRRVEVSHKHDERRRRSRRPQGPRNDRW